MVLDPVVTLDETKRLWFRNDLTWWLSWLTVIIATTAVATGAIFSITTATSATVDTDKAAISISIVRVCWTTSESTVIK